MRSNCLLSLVILPTVRNQRPFRQRTPTSTVDCTIILHDGVLGKRAVAVTGACEYIILWRANPHLSC